MKYTLILFALLIFASCSDTALKQELATTKADLKTAQSNIATLKAQIEPEGELVHVVLFRLQPDADQAKLIAEVNKMKDIEGLMDLQVGPFKELGDKRAMSEYAMMMEMSFENEAAYQKYQAHPLHLALKENAKSLMAGPPATYDYLKQ